MTPHPISAHPMGSSEYVPHCPATHTHPAVHVYSASEEEPAEDEEGEEGVPAFREWLLPCAGLRVRGRGLGSGRGHTQPPGCTVACAL